MDIFFGHLRFLDGTTDPNSALIATHNPLLVLLSIITACIAAYSAFKIVSRINAAQSFVAKGVWLATGAVTMGIGVWAMHFVAMLAFILPVPVGYSIPLTIASVIPSIFASAVMLHVISRDQIKAWQLLVGGTLMGAGIGVMHYTGMAAMQMNAIMLYDPYLFTGSIFVAVLLATLALYTKFFVKSNLRFYSPWTQVARWTEAGSAIIMGFAVSGMHYTGMAAASYYPITDPNHHTAHGMGSHLQAAHPVGAVLDPLWLGAWVSIITVIITGIALIITILDQRMQSARKHREELEELVAGRTSDLKATNAQLQAELKQRQLMEEELARARDQALEGSRLKSEFLATVSHEIRTPLNGIIGMAHLLLDNPSASERTDYLETICYSAESLLTVLNDVLDLSTVEAGKMAVVKRAFKIDKVIRDAVRLLSLRAQEKNLTLDIEMAPDLPDWVYGDDMRLRQVLVNLVGNAIKFTEIGGVVIGAEIISPPNTLSPKNPGATIPGEEKTAQQSLVARFSVRDTGIGLAETSHDRLFQPFSQVDSSLARKHSGAGLGLAICKRLVELMGGDIGVESVLGSGSLFWFTIPLTLADEEAINDLLTGEPAHTSPSPLAALGAPQLKVEPDQVTVLPEAPLRLIPTPRNGTGSKTEGQHSNASAFSQAGLSQVAASHSSEAASGAHKVLLVEDNPVNQKVAIVQLQRLGLIVYAVNNGLEAVAALQQRSFDLVLMDCQMPEMDGFEATRAIRTMERQTGLHVPIIAMTANAMSGDREACLAVGMDDYLSKPFNPQGLRTIVGHWLKP